MTTSFLRIFASFRGRIARTTFWWATLAAGAVFILLFVFLETLLGRPITLILYPPFLWTIAALMVKRLHDRAKSGWWLLVAVLPIIGPLWLLLTLGLRAGTDGENQYGEDSRTVGADYLTVR
jgi:uncharacterized membrane protein YhaH (DUF805 family)